MKNESKWNYAQVVIGEGQGTYRVYVEDGPTICENIRTEAEAQMLAAAPDMLEACKLSESHHLPTPVLIALRNAIIKANGGVE